MRSDIFFGLPDISSPAETATDEKRNVSVATRLKKHFFALPTAYFPSFYAFTVRNSRYTFFGDHLVFRTFSFSLLR